MGHRPYFWTSRGRLGLGAHARLDRGHSGHRLLARHLRVDVLPATRRRRGDDAGRPAPRAVRGLPDARAPVQVLLLRVRRPGQAQRHGRGHRRARGRRTRRPTTWRWRASSRRPSWSTTTWARCVASTRACGTAASSTRTPCTATRGTSYFVVEEQSTVFHKLALEPGYHFEDATLAAGMAYKTANNVAEGIREAWPGASALRTVRAPHELCDHGLHRGRDRCQLLVHRRGPAAARDDHLIVHDASATGSRRRCTAPSCAWEWRAVGAQRRLPQGRARAHNAVCLGMPVGAGMILANGSVFLSRDAGRRHAAHRRAVQVARATPPRLRARALVCERELEPRDARPPRRSPVPPLLLLPRSRPSACSRWRTRCRRRPTARAAHAAAAAGAPASAHAARAAARRHHRPAHVVARHVQQPRPRGPTTRSNALFYLYCGFGPACGGSGDTSDHRLPRALPQVGLAALRPDHGAPHDRPGHLPLERVPVRVQ